MYRSNEEGNWPCIYDLRDPHVQRVQFTSEVPAHRGGVAELQPLSVGAIRDAVVVVRLPVPVRLFFDGDDGVITWLLLSVLGVCYGARAVRPTRSCAASELTQRVVRNFCAACVSHSCGYHCFAAVLDLVEDCALPARYRLRWNGPHTTAEQKCSCCCVS